MAPPFQVYIVESPSFQDIYREKTEGKLLAQGLALMDIPVTLRLAGHSSEFRQALAPELADLKDSDTIHLLVHLSAHGSNDGLRLTSDERISWSDLRSLLIPLNARLKDRLVLCVSSCHGFQAIQTAMTSGELPFCVLVGNKGRPTWSETGVGYLAFYHVIAKGGSIRDMMEAMKKASCNPDFDLELGKEVQSRFSQSVLAGLR